jgi:uncharacterized membrane protein YccC
VFLGIIASAIAETDDNWWGRTKAVLLSLLCFCRAASVIWLFPWPWIFIGALALSTFCLTLLGALGERYASIAQATVTLAIYTMIGLEQHGASDLHSALDAVSHLLAGAVWYGLLSILWTALFANRPVRERVARLYGTGPLPAAESRPVRAGARGRPAAPPARPGRAEPARGRRAERGQDRDPGPLRPFRPAGVNSGLYLRLYYMAQDFHERASSSHYPYGALVTPSSTATCCTAASARPAGRACARLGGRSACAVRSCMAKATSRPGATWPMHAGLPARPARPEWQRLLGSLDLLVHSLRSIGAACWT